MSDTLQTFRVVPPRWAHDPLSGEGARQHGGRFNPPGTVAFYSALDPHTAYAEYTQNLFDRPGLLCAFDTDGGAFVDLRGERCLEWGLTKETLSARWAGLDGTATQAAAMAMIDADYDGAIYSSLQHPPGSNLVLWRWNQQGHPTVTLRDRFGEKVRAPFQ